MSGDDLRGDIQTKPRARGFGGKKGREDLLAQVFGNAAPRIGHNQFQRLTLRTRRYQNPAPSGMAWAEFNSMLTSTCRI